MTSPIHPDGLLRLAFAVCRQWVDDKRPENSKEMVKQYALLIKDAKAVHRREWYKQAVFVMREADHGDIES